MDITHTLCLFIELPTLNEEHISIDIQRVLSLIPPETLKRNELTFSDRAKYFKGKSSSVCYYCKIADSKSVEYDEAVYGTFETKLNNKYSMCCSKFGLIKENNLNLFKLDSDFISKYSNLKYFSLKDILLECNGSVNGLSNLLDIQLDNNNLVKLPDSIWQIKSLKSLSLINNPITSFKKDAFLVYTQLESLEVDNLRLQMKKDELINLPSSIKNLIIKNFLANFIPFDLKDCLNSFKSLTFSGVPWVDTTEYAAYLMWSLSKELIYRQYEHIFTKEQIEKIFRYFDVNKDDSLSQEEASNFNAFIFKKFPRIDRVPKVVFSLINLIRLDLSFQKIISIPDEIENLVHLNKLILNNCTLLDNLSPKISGLPLKKLDLRGCISLKTPPPEIVKRGLTSILSFLKRLLTGSVLCKKTKLMLVIFYYLSNTVM